MSRAFVTQENPNFDYSPVEKYGEPVFVTASDFSGSSNSLFNEDLMKIIRAMMDKFDVDSDYLVPSGSPLVTSFCIAALKERGVSRFPILRWSNRDRDYRPVTINF